MQIMPATLREIAEKSDLPVLDTNDPGANIAAGIFYDRNLYERWEDIPTPARAAGVHLRQPTTAAAAASCAPRTRASADCLPCGPTSPATPPEETQRYVARILTLMGHDPP